MQKFLWNFLQKIRERPKSHCGYYYFIVLKMGGVLKDELLDHLAFLYKQSIFIIKHNIYICLFQT